MGLSRVYNDNSYPFRQEYKGKMIEIAPKDFVEMEREEAVIFKGLFYPPQYDASDVQKPESYKKLRVVHDAEIEQEAKPACMICGEKFEDDKELNGHMKKEHSDAEPIKDEQAEKAMKGGRNVQKTVRF